MSGRREHAQWKGDQNGKNESENRQGDSDLQPIHHLGADRFPGEHALTEVTPNGVGEPIDVLHWNRPIEPQLFPKRRDRFGSCPRS